MAQLAIKGHATRGKEVIEILEMLGGKNLHHYRAGYDSLCYYIGKVAKVICYNYVKSCYKDEDILVFTLEEFLEKFPYKVGDKVDLNGVGVEITGMYWLDNTISYEGKSIKLGSEYDCLSVQDLKPLQSYKEETMENKPNLLQQLKEYFDNTPREVIEKEWHEYDKYNEIGPSVEEYLEYVNNLRQPKYPKTYEECCDVLKIPNDERYIEIDVPVGYNEILFPFTELIICRNAYWKIAGEQMGLGKTWKPSANDEGKTYSLYYNRYTDNIDKFNGIFESNAILDFPTKEMRDAFYENFKELIETCKELL